MSIWHGDDVTVEQLNANGVGTLNAATGIEITEIAEASLKGRMPVNENTVQPAGALHGGASVAFAETLASWASYLVIDRSRFHAVGQEINANHVRPGANGTWVYGEATPAAIGRRSHVWEMRITNEAGKLVCISRCTMAVVEAPSTYTSPDQRD